MNISKHGKGCEAVGHAAHGIPEGIYRHVGMASADVMVGLVVLV